jgi:MSHA biogenesis protein MshI
MSFDVCLVCSIIGLPVTVTVSNDFMTQRCGVEKGFRLFSFSRLLKFKSKSKSGQVGLEVRADGIAVAVAKLGDGGEFYIKESKFQECKAAERVEVLTKLVDDLGAKGLPCNLVLPSKQYQTYPIEKPKVEDIELVDAARWRIKDLLDFDLADAVTDVYEFPSDALRGRPEQLNVVVGRSAIIKEAIKLVAEAGLELESIDIVDLALRNVAARFSEDEHKAQAVLYLRNGAGMMVLVKNSDLYLSRHFDFSLQSLNDPSQQDSVIQNLALEVQRSFDYFESQMGQVPPRIISLIGPDSDVPLAKMLGASIAADVAWLDLACCYGREQIAEKNEINCFAAIAGAIREVSA